MRCRRAAGRGEQDRDRAAAAAVVPGTTARRILGRRVASLCLASVACQPIQINDPRVSDDGYTPVTYRKRSRWLGTEGD